MGQTKKRTHPDSGDRARSSPLAEEPLNSAIDDIGEPDVGEEEPRDSSAGEQPGSGGAPGSPLPLRATIRVQTSHPVEVEVILEQAGRRTCISPDPPALLPGEGASPARLAAPDPLWATVLDESYWFEANGVAAATGRYLLEDFDPEALARRIFGDPSERPAEPGSRMFLPYVDPGDLGLLGWGVIFAAASDEAELSALREALDPLLQLRRRQAARLFQELSYLENDSVRTFLARREMGPGVINPHKVPYYLLIVGDPESIPWSFQYELGVGFAVGRIHFESLDEYRRYARSVVAAEEGEVPRRDEIAFFAPRHPGDRSTRRLNEHLVDPLAESLGTASPEAGESWKVRKLTGEAASKAQLDRLLGGDETPGILLAATHGVGYDPEDPHQRDRQGALLCQEWPGPEAPRPLTEDQLFAAEHLPDDRNLHGMVGFFTSCFGGGTPQFDDFPHERRDGRRREIAPRPFLARLPQRMLGHPGGGALAVLAHVDRAWTCSFSWMPGQSQPETLETVVRQILKGHPVGSAVHLLGLRYASLGSQVADVWERIRQGQKPKPHFLSWLWTAYNDARNFVLLGDPAVRLPAPERSARETDPESRASVDVSPDSGDRRALLIGIDRYPHLDAWAQLEGSVNDVRIMERTLIERFDFPPESIETLLDGEATRDGILGAIARLIDRVREDDVVVIHYSGHGSYRTDESEHAESEADKREETIVPSDSIPRNGEGPHRDIGSHELYDLLLRLTDKTQRVTLIFDCCHSGTITRDLWASRGRALPPVRAPWRRRSRSASAGGEVTKWKTGPSGWLPLDKRYTLIAACRADERARELPRYEDQKRIYGALTWHLNRELMKAEAEATWRDVFEPAALAVRGVSDYQHPQLEGAGDREIFGLEELAPTWLISVSETMDDRVVLAGGAAHGLSPGSVWQIYPPKTKSVEGAQCLGEVEVTEVGAVRSEAKILPYALHEKIAPLCRAHLIREAVDAPRLAVAVESSGAHPEWTGPLREYIEASTFLKLEASPADAELVVWVLPKRDAAGDGDPVPTVKSLEGPTCVVTAEGEVVMPLHPIAEADARTEVLSNLEKRARQKRLLELRHPASSRMAGTVKLRILDPKEADRPEDRGAAPADGPVYRHGDRFLLEITNHSEVPVFPYVIDIGIGGGIEVLYPMKGAREGLPPGETVLHGKRRGQHLTFLVPDEVRKLPRSREGVRATETLKLIASSENTNFRPLFQGSYRDVPNWQDEFTRGALGRLLTDLLTEWSREAGHVDSIGDAEWTASTLSLTLVDR